MDRRAFVHSALPVSLGAMLAPDLLRGQQAPSSPNAPVLPGQVLVLKADEGRTPTPLSVVGEEGLAKMRSADTGGQLAFFHFTAPPMTGPPLHRHSREDEFFYVLEGELVFQLDGVRHVVGPGGTVYSPRGIVHAYQNFTSRDARLLIGTTPGVFGNMFEEMSSATQPGAMPPMEVLEALHAKYGITTMGPPLTA